jgi:hypothetical protein
VRDGLLQQHGHVAAQAFRGHLRVQVVRGAHVHDVGRRRVQQGRQVGEARAVRALRGRGPSTGIDVADPHHLDVGVGQHRVEVDLGDVAAAHDGHPQPVGGHAGAPGIGRVATAQS